MVVQFFEVVVARGEALRYFLPLKWIPLSKSGASKSRLRWAAHTRIGNVWEYPPPGGCKWF